MKLVLFSDLHLDAPFEWAPRPLARRRRQALRDALSRIVALAVDVGADALLCGGDLYEQDRFSPETAELLRHSFAAAAPLPIYLAPGNHDWYGPESLYRRVAWTSNVHVFSRDRLEPLTLAEGLTLWGAAHCAPANTDGFLESFRVDRGGVHLALFHGSERGRLGAQGSGKVAHASFESAQLERAGLHHAFLGHYHCPVDAERHTYPGNPEPLCFGEDGARGVVIATVATDGTVARERRSVRTTELCDVEVDLTGCASAHEARARVAAMLAGQTGAARITLTGELAADADLMPRDLEDAAPWLEALVVRAGAIRAAYDVDAIAQEATVRGQFVRDVRAAELPEDERRRVLITGLRALDGRADLDVL